MKCGVCGHSFPANRNSPAIGGFSAPGVFFRFNLIAAGLVLALYLTGRLAYAIVAGIILLFGLAANLTSWWDSRVSQEADGSASLGLRCPHCDTKNIVHPWSL